MKANYKYIVVAAATLLSFTRLHAQFITGGVEGEITITSVKISDINNSLVNAVNGKNIIGYEIGPYLRVGLGSLYIKPKFLGSFQSGIVQVVYPDQHSQDVTLSVAKIDVPVLLGIRIIGHLSVEGGPIYTRIISATNNFNGNNIDVTPGGLGYRIGANAQIGIIGFNVAYQGIKNNSSGSTLSSFETPDELIFGLSLSFGEGSTVTPYNR